VDIRNAAPAPLSVVIEPASSAENGDKKLRWQIDTMPTAFNRKEERNGLTLYIWEEFNYRVLTRVGTTVVDISAPLALRNYVLPVLDSSCNSCRRPGARASAAFREPIVDRRCLSSC
jgi:hypothetical protein